MTNLTTTTVRNRFRAVVLGLACGDALGHPTEFSSVERIRQRYGPEGIKDINQTSGRYTDDTQMAEALGLGLLDAADNCDDSEHGQDDQPMHQVDYVMPYVAERFVEWSIAPYNNRAPGGTCMGGCEALRKGTPWTKSGRMNSKGCGSVMRSAPVGLVYLEPHLGEVGRASSIVTHGHQAALDASHLGALAVRLILEGEPVENLCSLLLQHAVDENLQRLLTTVPHAIVATLDGQYAPEVVQTHQGAGQLSLGESWVGDEALASALYCFLLAHARGEGYVEAVRYGANTKGDSDSIAAIAGQFAGAYWGLNDTENTNPNGIPVSWVEHVERNEELTALADRLYDLHVALYPESQSSLYGNL